VTKEYESGKVKPQRVREAAVAYNAREEEPVMSTISSKNQITLPVHLLREMGIGAGDRVAVTREGNRLMLRARPKDWVKYHAGSLEGRYGADATAAEDYVRDLREGGREEEIEEAWDGQ
jgi:bifunctional DNA-binding transcriptional regulator/antitoxin component of YhaV-PrlF toxin-antitoxin module